MIMLRNKNKTEQTEVKEELPLPLALQKRFLKQMFGAVCVAALTVVLLFYYKRWEISFGFLLALFIIWMGFDTNWRYQRGDIVCKQMICIKATRILKQDRIYAVLQELNYEGNPENATHHYYIPTSKKEAALIDSHVILNCYVAKNNTAELITWEIIGNAN